MLQVKIKIQNLHLKIYKRQNRNKWDFYWWSRTYSYCNAYVQFDWISDSYSHTSGSLWQFKRDEIERDVDLTVDSNNIPNIMSSFKYKSKLTTNRNSV